MVPPILGIAAQSSLAVTLPRPQLGPIKALHRHDGYISFATCDVDGAWKSIASIRATALDEFFPAFTDELLRDSLVSINASYSLAYGRRDLPYGRPCHRNDTLRYLCACYCDLDYYKLGLESHEVIGEIVRMQNAGEIPKISMSVDSGRGIWVLWCLHSEDDEKAAHLGAFGDNPNDHLQLYTRINQELSRRLEKLGADRISDGARHIRLPGSFRNGTERTVEWAVHGSAEKPHSYSLKELAASVGVLLPARPKVERHIFSARARTFGDRSRGWKRANENRLMAIATIKDLRGGGFSLGMRNRAAFFLCSRVEGHRRNIPGDIIRDTYDGTRLRARVE